MQIKYDNEIAIALGKSRKEMRWKNRDIMWSLFIQKLSETHKTHETLAEYLKSDKSRQDEIKDIGGFVGGTLSEGRRRADSVLSRSVITLDVDNVISGMTLSCTMITPRWYTRPTSIHRRNPV